MHFVKLVNFLFLVEGFFESLQLLELTDRGLIQGFNALDRFLTDDLLVVSEQ